MVSHKDRILMINSLVINPFKMANQRLEERGVGVQGHDLYLQFQVRCKILSQNSNKKKQLNKKHCILTCFMKSNYFHRSLS